MTVGFYANVPGDFNRNNPVSTENALINKATMLGINVESFYEIDTNGVKKLNIEKLMTAISEAELKNNNKEMETASQSDAFVKTTQANENDKTAITAAEKQDAIEKEYKNAFVKFYNQLNTAADADQTAKKAADAWADAKEKHYNLTKSGVSNATVIAGATDCIAKLETAIDMTIDSVDETEKNIKNNFFIKSTDNENANNFFANNPFFQSAMETSEENEEKAEEIAA